MPTPRRLLAQLRDLMASGTSPLPELVRIVAAELVSEVCSIYALRPGEILELVATEGLLPAAVGRTRLRVGEGIIGLVAATGKPLNLPDAQNHPAFAYRPQTGEEPYASMLAVPIRRGGRILGVLSVQNRTPRRYEDDEVDEMATVAMLLAETLAAGGFQEGLPESPGGGATRRFAAAALAPGVVIGRLIVFGVRHAPRRLLAEDTGAEHRRLLAAVDAMQRGLDELIATGLPKTDGRSAAANASREILDAYRMVAADAGWLKRVSDAVQSGLTAEAAVHRVADDLRERMRRITDPYLRERLADLEDLTGRLLAALGGNDSIGEDASGAILLARRLGPAELLDWHARGIAGVVIEDGHPSSHAAILARALGIAAVGGVSGMMDTAEDNDIAILDAEEGAAPAQVILRPRADVTELYQGVLAARDARQVGWAALRERPARTRDGTSLRLMLNVGLPLELAQLDATGANGIGLFRSEIAMLARGAIADVAEQAALYARVLEAAGPRPVLFRTLDLGSDKMLPGAPHAEEENPAMGWRSLRIGLDRPAVLRRQLRALLLASGGGELSVMFPMVATVAEFRAARALLEAEAQRVRPAPSLLRAGAMLEVPALLWQLPALLAEVDFLSVGTNDLLQFLFAADRGAPGLAGRYDLLSPPVLDLFAEVIAQAAAAHIPVSVCGEAAARPLEAMTLVGLGIDTLSMPAANLLAVKALLAELDLPAFRPVLAAIRRTAAGAASLREPIAAWAREHGLPV